MSKNTEGFNQGGVVTIKDEVVSYLDSVVAASPQVSYTLPEDDEKGQRFEIMISDEKGVPKGAINLSTGIKDQNSFVMLSPAGDYDQGYTQTLDYLRVDQILKQVERDSAIKIQYLPGVTAYIADATKGFSNIESAISNFLDQASEIIATASHNRNPNDIAQQRTDQATSGVVVVVGEPPRQPA